MMKFIERLDQHMGVKTWVANPTARSASSTPTGTSQYPSEPLSRRPSASNLHQLRRQPSADEQRKLKEQRLAELARQLESTHLQNDPVRPKHMPQAPSRSLSPIPQLSPEPLYPPMSNVELEWQERMRKAEEINSRIELLRSSGLPVDRIPSPVQLPSRSVSGAPMDRIHLNSLPHDYFVPPPSSSPIDQGLRHQPSNKSLSSLPPPHPIKSSPSMVFQKNHIPKTDRSPSLTQVGYYQALKEAESLIFKLRKSHDDLLERVSDLETQLNLQKDGNRDLTARNQRLEAYLSDEQNAKKESQIENERLKHQLKSLSLPSHTSSISQNPQTQFPHAQPKSQLGKSYQETAFDPMQSGSGPLHHISSARAELLKREENLQRHYAFNYSISTIRPQPIQPGSNMPSQTSPYDQPAPKSNVASSSNSNPVGGKESKNTSAFQFLSNLQSYPNGDPDPATRASHLTDDQKPNQSSAFSTTHPRRFGSNGFDDIPASSHYQQGPLQAQFGSHEPHPGQSSDQLPIPPFMNDELLWNYHNPPGNLRHHPFPTYGYY